MGADLIIRRGRCSGRALLLAAVSLLVLGESVSAQTSVYEKILTENKIGADPTSLAKYLKELHPTASQRERVNKLVRQLGDASFNARETAMAKLLVMPALPTEALVRAMAGNDPEIRWRARKLLDVGKPEAVNVMHSAFQVIAAKKTPGVTADLLAAIPLCEQPYLKAAARHAIDAAATRQDAAILRDALGSEHVGVRVAAISALGKVLGQDPRTDLYPSLKDREDEVQLAAARVIADLGDRKCLPTLVAMLDSDDLSVRTSAASALRQLSGRNFGFAAYESLERRAKVVDQWKAWIQGDGMTTKLRFPLKRVNLGHLDGNTLLAFGHKSLVVEYDPAGKEVWTYTARSPWRAEKLANGNVLIADVKGGEVVQVNRQGKVVWKYAAQHPVSAKMLAGGNVLIAMYTARQAIEVNSEGKVVWKHAVPKHCTDAHRLENGNTLIASQKHFVVEVTPAGKVVWKYSASDCYGCQPLANGNVLIASMTGRVIEVTRNKKIVWECQHAGATDAFRLPNGNTLISGRTRFVEMTPDKKIVWSKDGCQYGSARR